MFDPMHGLSTLLEKMGINGPAWLADAGRCLPSSSGHMEERVQHGDLLASLQDVPAEYC